VVVKVVLRVAGPVKAAVQQDGPGNRAIELVERVRDDVWPLIDIA